MVAGKCNKNRSEWGSNVASLIILTWSFLYSVILHIFDNRVHNFVVDRRLWLHSAFQNYHWHHVDNLEEHLVDRLLVDRCVQCAVLVDNSDTCKICKFAITKYKNWSEMHYRKSIMKWKKAIATSFSSYLYLLKLLEQFKWTITLETIEW